MTLFSSFSITLRDNVPVDAVTSTTLFQSFSLSALLISPGLPSNVVCRYFALTIPELSVIEEQRDPFGLITHKKK